LDGIEVGLGGEMNVGGHLVEVPQHLLVTNSNLLPENPCQTRTEQPLRMPIETPVGVEEMKQDVEVVEEVLVVEENARRRGHKFQGIGGPMVVVAAAVVVDHTQMVVVVEVDAV